MSASFEGCNMKKIIVVFTKDEDGTSIVSHGIDLETMAVVSLPQERAESFIRTNKVRFDSELGEYVLPV